MILKDNKSVIIGGGGHFETIFEVLNEKKNKKEYKISFIIDDKLRSKTKYNINIISTKKFFELKNYKNCNVFLAIGDNEKRKKIYSYLKKRFYKFPNLVSDKSYISKNSIIGDGNQFLIKSYIGPSVIIKTNNIFNTNSIIEHNCKVGSDNHFAPMSVILGNSEVANENLIGSNATVLNNLKIKNKITIGAGSLVNKDILNNNGKYVGVPIKSVK